MAISVRAATAADVGLLLVMMADFNALEDLPWPRHGCEEALRRLIADVKLGTVQLYVGDGEVCGYFVLTWGFDLEWNGRDSFLTEFYLRPEARGRGLGRAALGLVEQVARAFGAQALHLMVRPENAAAFRLYLGAGFESPPRVFLSKPLT